MSVEKDPRVYKCPKCGRKMFHCGGSTVVWWCEDQLAFTHIYDAWSDPEPELWKEEDEKK